MADDTLRRILISEIDDLYERITKDFAAGEYPPKEVLIAQFERGGYEGFFLVDENHREAAYAICSSKTANGYVLLSLLAVYEPFRGHGLGKRLICALISEYAGRNGLIAEVEIPDHASDETNRLVRFKRIDFYRSLGFDLVHGITYVIWDVPMYLMVKPLAETFDIAQGHICQIMGTIYLDLMGERFIHKLECQTT